MKNVRTSIVGTGAVVSIIVDMTSMRTVTLLECGRSCSTFR